MFQDFVKATIEERERSVQELLRDRKLASARPSRVRWRSGSADIARRPNGQREL
jgi:hypothetical protein